jgi:beta-lactamase regulating signal transducer with metallopeptidase domain
MKNKFKNINKSFALLILLAVFISSLFVLIGIKLLKMEGAQTIYYCQQVISQASSLLSIPYSIPFFLKSILGLMVIAGTASLSLQIIKTYKILRVFNQSNTQLDTRVEKIANKHSLLKAITITENNQLISFCYGFITPKVMLSTKLISTLTDKEIEAVLIHEKSHITHRDNIKIIIGKTLQSLFFFLPIFKVLNKRMIAVNEIIADALVLEHQKTSTHLKTALKKFILNNDYVHYGVFSQASDPEFLETRIQHLVNPAHKAQVIPLKKTHVLCTGLLVVFGMLLVQTPVSALQTDNKQTSYLMGYSCNAVKSSSPKIYNTIIASPTSSPPSNKCTGK